jgi:glyoxylase-like metal-dependent hydrolase (beta-lactamase superfamily II)
VRHIVLTHMHFDHCAGLPDFPWAKVHIYRKEYEAFLGQRRKFTDMAYVQRHITHAPDWIFYDDTGGKWFDFDAIRLPFDPEMWLVPLAGHTRGLCGVAVKTSEGWLFQASDSAALFNEEAPGWLIPTGAWSTPAAHPPICGRASRSARGDRAHVAGLVREE